MVPMFSVGTDNDTICALSSVSGTAAIAVIRLSGPDAIAIIDKFFFPSGKKKILHEALSHTVHHGTLSYDDEILDEVVVNIYQTPRSYTGENMSEIFCHGSPYIQTRILEVLIALGCRMARPGEFTLRAFLNGKLDLSQAEAVADLIASQSKAAHDLSMKQLKGGFSKKIEALRRQLLQFTSLIELELDFSEEDVEFADRKKLTTLIEAIQQEITILLDSFKLGNVLKKGIPVTIIGKPNVGKSTLLNILLNEDRAIVSPTPGTTRDAIEDTITLDGISFRFIDTAGLRHATDDIEFMGIEKTIEKIKQAYIILYIFDIAQTSVTELNENLRELEEIAGTDDKKIVLIGNKSDMLVEIPATFKTLVENETIFISAKRRENINLITDKLTETVKATHFSAGDTVVSNARHHEALTRANSIVSDIIPLIQSGTSHELLAADLRRALLYLGEITGVQITSENILDEIFGNFCIGK